MIAFRDCPARKLTSPEGADRRKMSQGFSWEGNPSPFDRSMLHLKSAAMDGRSGGRRNRSMVARETRQAAAFTDERTKEMPRGPGGALGAGKAYLGRDRASRVALREVSQPGCRCVHPET